LIPLQELQSLVGPHPTRRRRRRRRRRSFCQNGLQERGQFLGHLFYWVSSSAFSTWRGDHLGSAFGY